MLPIENLKKSISPDLPHAIHYSDCDSRFIKGAIQSSLF